MKGIVWLSVLLWAGVSAKLDKAKATGLTQTCQLRYNLLQTELELWENVADPRWQEVRDKSDPGPDQELAKMFKVFCDSVEEAFPFSHLGETDPKDESWVWAKLSSERAGVDRLFESFRRFLAQPGPGGKAWEDLAETILEDPTNSVPSALDRMNRLVAHSNFYLQALQKHTNGNDANSHLCSLQQSPHQLLFNMYNTIALTEIKGYTMMQFSWMLLKIYGKGNFTRESDLMRQRFEERSTLALAAVKSAMKDASREIWRCDPQYHEEGETFVALTRLLQGYVENEVDMNADNTCRENCAYYNYAKNHGCFKDQFCSRQPACKGKILNCQYIDSDMWICPASRNSERRYEWIEYENQRVLGKKGSCMTGTSKVDSWWRWLFWHCSYCMCVCDQEGSNSDRHFSLRETLADVNNKFDKTHGMQITCGFNAASAYCPHTSFLFPACPPRQYRHKIKAVRSRKVDSWWRLDLYHCSYCLCVCDEPGPASDRHFSMLPAEADYTSNNRVVTGLRFTKVNKVIYLQISEGTLLPRGKIDTASIRWKAVTPIDLGSSKIVRGWDYHTMTYEERSIDLDDHVGSPGHLLTGVRLRKVGSHLNFEIRTTPFNFTTGKLLQPKERSAWISNDNTDAATLKPRTRLDLFKPDIPTRSVAGSVPDSHTDQYLEFTHSDLDADAAQSTVPFLDAQAAAPLLAVPLSGAGLFHKGRPHYGGFVAPKVFTYDFSQHMEPVFPVFDELKDNKFVF